MDETRRRRLRRTRSGDNSRTLKSEQALTEGMSVGKEATVQDAAGAKAGRCDIVSG